MGWSATHTTFLCAFNRTLSHPSTIYLLHKTGLRLLTCWSTGGTLKGVTEMAPSAVTCAAHNGCPPRHCPLGIEWMQVWSPQRRQSREMSSRKQWLIPWLDHWSYGAFLCSIHTVFWVCWKGSQQPTGYYISKNILWFSTFILSACSKVWNSQLQR